MKIRWTFLVFVPYGRQNEPIQVKLGVKEYTVGGVLLQTK